MYQVGRVPQHHANNEWNVSLLIVLREAESCVVMIGALHLLEFFQFIALGSNNSKRKDTNYKLLVQTHI